MLQNIFFYLEKNFLIDSHVKISDKNYWYGRFRKKLLLFLQGDIVQYNCSVLKNTCPHWTSVEIITDRILSMGGRSCFYEHLSVHRGGGLTMLWTGPLFSQILLFFLHPHTKYAILSQRVVCLEVSSPGSVCLRGVCLGCTLPPDTVNRRTVGILLECMLVK